MKLRIDSFHQVVKLSYFSIDASVFMVHGSQEAISQVSHNPTKAEKEVTLEKFFELLGFVGVIKAVIQASEYLIHPLDILDTWIELRIDEQDP